MTYSTSEKALKKVEHFLVAMLNVKGDAISWIVSDPSNIAYKIRQATTIAKDNPDKFPEFATLKDKFKICISKNTVTAVRFIPVAEVVEQMDAAGFTKHVNTYVVAEVKEVMEAVGAILGNPNFEEYHFSDYTEITKGELNQLYKWTSKNGYFIVNALCLIITKKEPAENLAWVPEQLKQAI